MEMWTISWIVFQNLSILPLCDNKNLVDKFIFDISFI